MIPIVNIKLKYDYAQLSCDINLLKQKFPYLETGIIGKSVNGRNLYYIRLGYGKNEVFYNGAHHGMEWITSLLLMSFIENISIAYTKNSGMFGHSINELYKKTSLYIVPMVNPDGVDLSINGLNPSDPSYEQLIAWNSGATDFTHWQANYNGVDLNHNYDAMWQESKLAEKDLGILSPGPTRFSGQKAESEPESHAVADFTRMHNFKMVLAFHSQGEVIYWNFNNLEPIHSLSIGKAFERVSPYKLDTTEGIASYGGYKDWFIKQYIRPGYTIEVGLGENPLPLSQFSKIYYDTVPIILSAAAISSKL